MLIFPLAPYESGWFFVLLTCSSGDKFLPTNRAVELLFPSVRSGSGNVSSSFYSYGVGLFCFVLLVFPLVLADR